MPERFHKGEIIFLFLLFTLAPFYVVGHTHTHTQIGAYYRWVPILLVRVDSILSTYVDKARRPPTTRPTPSTCIHGVCRTPNVKNYNEYTTMFVESSAKRKIIRKLFSISKILVMPSANSKYYKVLLCVDSSVERCKRYTTFGLRFFFLNR